MAKKKVYRYTECGLDNVVIEGLEVVHDDAGELVYVIPNVNGLHCAIADSIVWRQGGMTGEELRFLRTELGLTQAELAATVHRDHQSIGRWERGECPMEGAAETIVRLLSIEQLGLDPAKELSEISSRCVPTATPWRHVIDGHDPKHYRSRAA